MYSLVITEQSKNNLIATKMVVSQKKHKQQSVNRVPCLCSHLGCKEMMRPGIRWRDHMQECHLLPQVTPENLVLTTDIGREIDLDALFWRYRNKGFVKREHKFPSVIVRIKGGPTVSIFMSGKIVCPGSKTIEGAATAIYRILLMIMDVIGSFPLPVIHVRNVVGCLRLGRHLDLELLKQNIPRSVLVPKKFPGLLTRMNTGVHALIYSSGSIVLTGARTLNDLDNSARQISKRLCHQDNKRIGMMEL